MLYLYISGDPQPSDKIKEQYGTLYIHSFKISAEAEQVIDTRIPNPPSINPYKSQIKPNENTKNHK